MVDHIALVWLLKRKEPPTGKLARWVLLLQEYQYSVVHRPGKLHILADALSRLPRVREDPVWLEPDAPDAPRRPHLCPSGPPARRPRPARPW